MFDDNLVRYEIDIEPDYSNPFDHFEDEETAESVLIDRDNNGNDWAWCIVTVTARYDGVGHITGCDTLGACSYAGVSAFRNGDYYEEMKDAARGELYSALESILARFGCIDGEGRA
jgi:hypothetical protein